MDQFRFLEEVNAITGRFSFIGLEEAESVKLFNRIDQKYIFHVQTLAGILKNLTSEYDILMVNGYANQPYRSLYFDTREYAMYYAHHNGHSNRYKIRIREYASTHSMFLEVKFKSNQDRTIKSREKVSAVFSEFDEASQMFIQRNTVFSAENLRPQTWTNFNRITLIHKERKERVTVDTSPEWLYHDYRLVLPSLVIAEVKREKQASLLFSRSLYQQGIRPCGISKYSIGSAMLNPELRKNMFKSTILSIQKICNNELPSFTSAGIDTGIRN